MFQPWIQTRRLAYAKHKHVISGILKHLRMHSLGKLITDEGGINEDVVEKLVSSINLVAYSLEQFFPFSPDI